MGTQYNSSLSNELRDVLKIQQGMDLIPQKYQDIIIPVVDVNPKHARVINVSGGSAKTTSGNLNLLTTNADKDFYLTNLTMSITKDVACDIASGNVSISGYIGGALFSLVNLAVLTLTAERAEITITFNNPIKLDRNTLLIYGGTFAAGACVRSGSYQGYLIDNSNA